MYFRSYKGETIFAKALLNDNNERGLIVILLFPSTYIIRLLIIILMFFIFKIPFCKKIWSKKYNPGLLKLISTFVSTSRYIVVKK